MRKLAPAIFASIILFTATPVGAQHCNVQKGDSMWRIAKEYNVIFVELLKLNKHFKNQNLIHPRDKVELPYGSTGAGSNKANTQGTDARTDDTADKDASVQAQAVLRLVNQERSKQGLSALTLDKRLNTAAQKKAEDMRDKLFDSISKSEERDKFFAKIRRERDEVVKELNEKAGCVDFGEIVVLQNRAADLNSILDTARYYLNSKVIILTNKVGEETTETYESEGETVIRTYVKIDENYKKYFFDTMLPYIMQVIPSTAILVLKDFD